MNDDSEFNLELANRVMEISEGIDDFDALARIVLALKAGKSVAIVRKDNRVSCWIDDEPR